MYFPTEQGIFERNASISRKCYEIRTKLLFMTNRKLHMYFPLDDLNCYKFEFSKNFVGFCKFQSQQVQNE